MDMKFWSENLTGGHHLEDLGIDGWIYMRMEVK
jgi:hypothetical protein